MKLSKYDISKIRAALKEDTGRGDVTSRLLIPDKVRASAYILAREAGVFCGGPVAQAVFKAGGRGLKVQLLAGEGQKIKKNEKVIRITGPLQAILAGERTALNFLGHFSGISTRTAAFTSRVKKYGVKILDTRKTMPLWRKFEKYAVKAGGGENHRMGLYDAVFVKENHRIHGDLKKLRKYAGNFEMEVRNLQELNAAWKFKPRVILLDNFTPAQVRKAVSFARKINPAVILEASGGINESNAAAYAAAGVDQISIGALTHSVKCLDFSLLIE